MKNVSRKTWHVIVESKNVETKQDKKQANFNHGYYYLRAGENNKKKDWIFKGKKEFVITCIPNVMRNF